MKRKLTLFLAIMLILTACSSRDKDTNKDEAILPSSTNESNTNLAAKEITTEDLLSTMRDEDKCWLNITPKQYLEDFDVLYQELQDNYPYFGILQRKHSIDLEKTYTLYRTKIMACKNDDDFFGYIRSFIGELEYTGHINSWGYRYTSEVKRLKSFIEEFPAYKETLTPYINKLDNPVSKRNYQSMESFYTKLQNTVDERNANIDPSQEGGSDHTNNEEEETETTKNATTDIIETGEIAYISIKDFDMESYKQDKEILLPFYEEVKNYKHLIIDISENSGGGMDYFNQLIVAPLAKEKIQVPCYLLAKGGENNKDFLAIPQGLKNGQWKPVSQLPDLPNMNQSDLAELDYFMEETYTIEPSTKQGFQGQLWLLVSSNNYSSSEYAAMFSKQSGFATLVGEHTSGDGIGVDPAYIILPNSGIVIQYSPIYGITSDGKNSEEYGTEPDYSNEEGETPLEACLRLIKKS